MEAVGAASAILGIATAGVQCSVKLVTFAGQVKIAPEQIGFIAEDVSLSASILQQLGELAKENMGYEPRVSDDNGNATNNNVKPVHDINTTAPKQSIFNATGLETVLNLAKKCEKVFESLNKSLRKASKQLHERTCTSGTVKLSRAEMIKWPFLFPGINTLRNELSSTKGTLMLMLQVAMLAYSRRMMEGYGENQHSTKIAVYSIEDQEVLVRSIVAAQKPQLGSPVKGDPEPSNIGSTTERSLKGERSGISQFSGPSNKGLGSADLELNGIARDVGKDSRDQDLNIHDEQRRDTGSGSSQQDDCSGRVPLSRQISQSQFEVPGLPVLRIFDIWLVSPRASIANQQIRISYSSRIIKLQTVAIESQLREWKEASKMSVLEQLAALDINEYDALDVMTHHSDRTILQEGTLEWIQFGDYCALIQGFENIKARTLTIVTSKESLPPQFERKEKKEEQVQIEEKKTTWIRVHRKHLLPETLTAYGLPWDWDETDSNYIIIKRWVTEDFQEELFAHTKQIREGVIEMSQLPRMSQTEIKVNDQNEDRLFTIREKPPPGWNDGFVAKVRQHIPFISRRKQEVVNEALPVRLRKQRIMATSEISSILNRKAAGEELEWKNEESSHKGQRGTDRKFEMEMEEHDDIEVLSESDDAEGIVDALLAKYTT